MGKPRACDVCSLRKIRCDGSQPCLPCVKAQFDCSFAKKPLKPGPKGPRATTSNRIRKRLHDIRSQAAVSSHLDPTVPSSSSSTTTLLSPQSMLDGVATAWLGDQESLPPSSYPPTSDGVRVTYTDVCTYLEIYHHKMYPVWPVVDRNLLVRQLGERMDDPETCALAFSVCAATGAQLRLDVDYDPVHRQEKHTIIDQFAVEAEQNRSLIDYRENATVACILIPFFLSMYYSSKKKRFTSTLLLRESLTLCELLDLDKEAVYATLEPQEQRYRRKIFWLLFVSERGTAMQYDSAAVLRNSISLPEPQDDPDPVLFMGFLSLVRLFVAVEGTLVGGGHNHSGHAYSTELFAQLQQQLQNNPSVPTQTNEVQKTDICVTQQWMRMLVWQLAMKKVSMTTGSSEDPLSLTYPAHVAKDSLAFLSRVSLDSVIAHGPGMELKIFEIANTLLDVINCVPSLTTNGSALMTQGPRDIFHGLSCLLSSLSGGQSRSLTLLQGKMAASSVPFQPIPRFIELEEDRITSPTSNEVDSGSSPTEYENHMMASEWPNSPTTLTLVPKHRYTNENNVDHSAWRSQISPQISPAGVSYDVPHPHQGLQIPSMSMVNGNGNGMVWPARVR